MTIEDAQSVERDAHLLVVEVRRSTGSPPVFDATWEPVWDVSVDRIDINHGSAYNRAEVSCPNLRWQETFDLHWGDRIRIRTANETVNTVLFSGFLATYVSAFSGGNVTAGNAKGDAYEHNGVVCLDHRWLLNRSYCIYGQFARSPDDYTNYGTDTQAAVPASKTFLSGRRAIFNRDKKPNMDPVVAVINDEFGNTLCQLPIFADPAVADPWTARDMIRYVLSPAYNNAFNYVPITDPNELTGLDHTDFDKVLSHIVVDTLPVIDAVELICRHLGFSFREDYDVNGNPVFVFYKFASATGYTRDSDNRTMLQVLYAPPVGEIVSGPVSEGKKMLWAMILSEDITHVVNNTIGFGAPQRLEFTSELVPAWDDADLTPDTAGGNAVLYFTEADLQDETDPDSKDFYKYYHPRGSSFKRDVGRKWCLNESGKYSTSSSYDRGMPFDFSTVIPNEHILNSDGTRNFAPFNRRLLACLTLDKDSLNSVGIKLEFSFDAGLTWQVIPASISTLADECGIYIDEANLAELVDQAEGTISGGTLDGVQLNYFTSISDDKLEARSFKDGEWKTRIRVTASVQMDQRLALQAPVNTVLSGSPFHHAQVYDFSGQYEFALRTDSSSFSSGSLLADDIDQTDLLDAHLEAVRNANEDMSVSGQFTLERLWLGDGSGVPDFMVGDSIEKIEGRQYNLSASFGQTAIYPEIIKITYMPQKQIMKLITRDLRYAEVSL